MTGSSKYAYACLTFSLFYVDENVFTQMSRSHHKGHQAHQALQTVSANANANGDGDDMLEFGLHIKPKPGMTITETVTKDGSKHGMWRYNWPAVVR